VRKVKVYGGGPFVRPPLAYIVSDEGAWNAASPLWPTYGVDHPDGIELAHPTSMMQNQISGTTKI